VRYGTNQARGESQAAHNNDRDHVVNSGSRSRIPTRSSGLKGRRSKRRRSKTLLTIAGHANQEMVCVLRQETIATKASQSERTVQRDIAALRSMGLILVRFGYDESGKRFASEITLLAEQTESRLPAKT
jgi:hypothetical protein